MSTENENWQDISSASDNSNAGRDGNQYSREGNSYSRQSYNREGGDRPYRPRFNPNAEGGDRQPRQYGGDRPYRPRFNNNDNNGYRSSYGGSERPFRSRYNNENGDRPQRSYNNNGGDRPYRPRYNNNNDGDRPSYGGSERPFRPRYNNEEGGDHQQHSYSNNNGYRPRYNNNNGDRPQRPYNNKGFRPRYNNNGEDGGDFQPRQYGDRPQRPRYNNNNAGGRGGYGNPYGRPQRQRSADYDPNAKYSKKKQIEYKEQFVDPNEPIRLNKFLANAGVCSRREADEFITAGVVSVNGEVVTELGTKIKRGDEVKFHDQTVSIERKIYIVLNKPKDTVTTSDDPQARKTVMDLVKGACDERIYPVGRLDRNTTGVLLLTNDGDLASKLTHPKYLKKKIYQVHLDKNLTKADMEQIAAGITLDDGEIHADAIEYTDETKKSDIGIEIHSGKNRIVRRIFESLGYKVMKLDRVFFAGLTKKGLRRGEWRYLSEAEVNYLRMGSFE